MWSPGTACRRGVLIPLTAILVLLCFSGIAGSANVVHRHVVGSGTIDQTVSSHNLRGTVGQATAGRLSHGSYNCDVGYWHIRFFDVTTSADGEGDELPRAYRLDRNYPNPFNPTTTIPFALPKTGRVTLNLYDLTGRMVATLIDEDLPAGEHSIVLKSDRLASGVYFYRIQAGDFVQSRRMMLVK
ncbi:MAG: T9SS type A sorting domain-containing protein [bacterium]